MIIFGVHLWDVVFIVLLIAKDGCLSAPGLQDGDECAKLWLFTPQESGLKVNHPASFAVRLNGAKGLIDAKVHSPSGALEECAVSELETDKYAIRFIPRENGMHSIDVRFNGGHIPGSPFQVRVGEPGQAGDVGLVTAYGAGLEQGVTGTQSEFIINNTKAGPGAVCVTIEGPSKVKMDCQQSPEGYKVLYTPMAPGNYLIGIKYGGPNHIVGSPFKVKVTGPRLVSISNANETSSITVDSESKSSSPSVYGALPKLFSDASAVQCTGAGLSKAYMGQKSNFSVDCSKAGKNMLLVGVHGPMTPCEEVYVKHMGNQKYSVSYMVKEKGDYILAVKWDKYAIRFIPRENGVHSIDVRFNGGHIPGSPFQVRVGEPGQAGDVGLVTAYGAGLEQGVTGTQSEFIINNTKAGPGAVCVTIEGPSKVKMDCQQSPEGYKVLYTPMAPGNYLIGIKYGGPNHIVGSPFKVKVTGPRLVSIGNANETSSITVDSESKSSSPSVYGALPKLFSDASAVQCTGAGLSKAYMGQKSNFSVDCSKAGKNMLLVGVHGPMTPCEEVYVKHMGNQKYSVSYMVKEKGDYILAVKWGEEHIPGSPFHVTVP
ncbi:UNVERIFIED_CONTAM: hypothetical protein FKN15_020594 [Acipenser sinensis]